MNGLGSNTCIQDSFNLAWKIAAVMKGHASPSLLCTFSTERQPVGLGIISRANDSFRNHRKICDALAMLSPSVNERKIAFAKLSAPSPAGKRRRAALRAAIEHSAHEFHAIGIEMNQHYESSAIYANDETEPFAFSGQAAEDPVLYYEPNTYPGSRLPHAWLNRSIPDKPVSTIARHQKGMDDKTVFNEILDSKLTDFEKKPERLMEESQNIAIAGTETTAWTLSVGHIRVST
jgi:hypothetical protein